MIGLEDRQLAARNILTAHSDGARLHLACEIVGIDVRTLQHWKAGGGLVAGDGRPTAVRPAPAHALSAAERAEVLRVANEPRFADVPPARIVPMLADEGVYALRVSVQELVCATGTNIPDIVHSWQVGIGVALVIFWKLFLFTCKGVQGDGEVIHSPWPNAVARRKKI
jgi:hypothetical protein